MSRTFVSVGVSIVDSAGYRIESMPANDGTELIHSIRMCAAGTAAAPAAIAARVATGAGSDAGVQDFDNALRIIHAGSMHVLRENP